MKVVLVQDVKNLGQKNDVIEVKPGFAFNSLFPKGVAIEATKETLRRIEQEVKVKDIQKEKTKEDIEEIVNSLPTEITFDISSNEKDVLFEKITREKIAEKLNINTSLIVNDILITEKGKYVAEIEYNDIKKTVEIVV